MQHRASSLCRRSRPHAAAAPLPRPRAGCSLAAPRCGRPPLLSSSRTGSAGRDEGAAAAEDVPAVLQALQAQPAPAPATSQQQQRQPGGRTPALSRGDVLQGMYTIVDVLGSGSTATAYTASTADGRVVAIKALSMSGMRDWKTLDLFQREAQVLASLEHPSIPKYIDYFEADAASDRSFYIVQEAVVGKTLAQMVSSGMRASDAEAARITAELLTVLEYLGGLRPAVIHRDIKPDNIVMAGGAWGGRVFLVDFGGVQGVADTDATALGSTVIGTYGYMAPEQFQGNAIVASDMYALGGTLLYLLTGRPPNAFPQERMRIKLGEAVSFPDGGVPWRALLAGLLEPVAEDRLSAKQAQAMLRGEAVALPRTRAGGRSKGAAASALSPPRSAREAISRMGMPLAGGSVSVAKPTGTRVVLERTPTRFDVTIPPAGLTMSTGTTGAFAIAWNAFVGFWTVGALAGGGVLFALFSLPFWFAGAQIGRQALVGALMRERLAFGPSRFRIAQELALLSGDGQPRFGGGLGESLVEGHTAQLLGARVITTVVVNGEPQTAIEVINGATTVRFGEGLGFAEQQWLVCEINAQLADMRGAPVDYEAFPIADVPETVYDADARTDVNDPHNNPDRYR